MKLCAEFVIVARPTAGIPSLILRDPSQPPVATVRFVAAWHTARIVVHSETIPYESGCGRLQ